MNESIEIAWDLPDLLAPLVSDKQVERAARTALEHGERGGRGLAVVFVDDARLTRMHAEYLDDPTPTDVITFALGEDEPGPIGELYISAERAQEVSERRKLSVERELLLYVVHGALHLCGFDDQEVEQRVLMRAAEDAVLSKLGFPPLAGPHEY